MVLDYEGITCTFVLLSMFCILIITGVVVAVYGLEPTEERGRFHVEDFCYQTLPEQVPHPVIEEDW